MKNTEFAIGSKIQVCDPTVPVYRWRGRIVEEVLATYPEGVHIGWRCALTDPISNKKSDDYVLSDEQIVNIQKKFIDIEHIKENDVNIGKDAEGNNLIRKNNTSAFHVGDHIVIQQKIDGANASICYNPYDNKLEVFSRTNLLDEVDGLRGFKQYIETQLDQEKYDFKCPDYVVFGEWLVSHKCQYDKEYYGKWYVYDIWSKKAKNYLKQETVKEFCQTHGLIYVMPLYDGPFISWEHCRQFMNVNPFGKQQEGIVVKNQTMLFNDEIRAPKYLKIVNDSFKESMKVKIKKDIDPAIASEMLNARNLMSSIITEARVQKSILKLIDNEILPKELTPKCMGIIMKYLPKMIWEDVLKEEKEIVLAAGEYASKFCSQITSEIARKIIIGK